MAFNTWFPTPGRSPLTRAAVGGSTSKMVPEGSFSGLQNPYDPERSRSVSAYDIPHFLSMSGVWDLPFGRGKRYLSQGIASQVLGNWQLNGMVQLRSGQPYNLSVAGDVANIGNTLSFCELCQAEHRRRSTPRTPNAK